LFTSDEGGIVFARVCLCLLATVLKNVCMDLYEMLRVDSCVSTDVGTWTN